MPKFKPNTGFRMESPLKNTKLSLKEKAKAGAKALKKSFSGHATVGEYYKGEKQKIRQSKKKSVLEYKKPAAPKMYGKKSGAPKFMGTGAIGMLGQVLNRRK